MISNIEQYIQDWHEYKAKRIAMDSPVHDKTGTTQLHAIPCPRPRIFQSPSTEEAITVNNKYDLQQVTDDLVLGIDKMVVDDLETKIG
jgi:hypothetical protein